MSEGVLRSCVDCRIYKCIGRPGEYPDFCLTADLTEETLQKVKDLYADPENRDLARISTEIEAELFTKYTRVQEIIEFARRMGYHKIGIATCIGLIRESRIFAKILRINGFEVYGAICKVGGMEKAMIGVPPEKTEATGPIMCNPILQAELLNQAGTELNVVVGLCVGHDSLFYKYSEAVCTTLITKDRVLGHNPAAAIVFTNTYYEQLLQKQE
ncbi:MAG: DUF1847 domain-containing protein [Clostridia bacterium]|nr:DUF1847 domain-containing protein [Clostridia bacterium]